MAAIRFPLPRLLVCLAAWLAPIAGLAKPAEFEIPAQPATEALLAFSRQAGVEVLFSFDELRTVQSAAVTGQLEPDDALRRLLRDTGFSARRSLTGKYVVARAKRPTGAVSGRLVTPAGDVARGVAVVLVEAQLRATTDATGAFLFPAVPPGRYRLVAGGTGWRVLERTDIAVEANRTTELPAQALVAATGVTELEPYLVRDRDARLPIGEGVGAAPRRAAGNLDLPRTEDNAMPFTVFSREQITRSGVVQLNEFFQRELLDGGSNSPPPEQDGNASSFVTGSSNLGLRGYGSDQTVVLLNGRRLPETFTASTGMLAAPDVNLVPVSLVQQIEVLPVSASALYSGNAVGGVINIVLRDFEGTEIRTTYTNALGGFDAPQATVSLQYGKTLLDGKLRLRLNGTLMQAEPAVETELGLQRSRLIRTVGFAPRATPNIASANGTPLFAGNPATFTSVAPGADGSGGLSAFAGREGVYSNTGFDAPGGLAASINALDYPYGREQRRSAWYGSMVYDALPWLQVGLDAHYANTVVHRGYELFNGTLRLAEGAGNPFGQEVTIALNEVAPALGLEHNEARIESYALVGGLLFRLPANWQVSLDGQYARNVARYRGTLGADPGRWQELVDDGRYNPLRDTQVFGPPQAFNDEAIIHYGGAGRFVTLGDYETFEGAVRVTNESLPLPTGPGTVNLGADYRLGRLAPYLEELRFADGSLAHELIPWTGRSLERISVFGELQGPLWPARKLPHPLTGAEVDLGLRYIVSTQSNETSFAPTIGLKLDFAGGFAFRGSYTTSNRFPTPLMSRPLAAGSGGGSTSDTVLITDPLRNESYEVEAQVAVNPNVRPENAATQSAGIIWQRGKIHRVRASIDFADTRKTNEFIVLEAQPLMNLEEFYPDRVRRQTPPPPATAPAPLRVTTILTGPANAAERHSQNWSFVGEYSWREFAGGSLDLSARWVHFSRYDVQRVPGAPAVDELDEPDGLAPQLLRDRLTFGAGWSQPLYGFGVDAHYLGARQLPEKEWIAQGSDHVKDYWQLDVYAQTDLTRWLPRRPDRLKLTAQLRINNLSGFDFPKYVNDPSGASVQPYGDWRGRTYSFSFAAEF